MLLKLYYILKRLQPFTQWQSTTKVLCRAWGATWGQPYSISFQRYQYLEGPKKEMNNWSTPVQNKAEVEQQRRSGWWRLRRVLHCLGVLFRWRNIISIGPLNQWMPMFSLIVNRHRLRKLPFCYTKPTYEGKERHNTEGGNVYIHSLYSEKKSLWYSSLTSHITLIIWLNSFLSELKHVLQGNHTIWM